MRLLLHALLIVGFATSTALTADGVQIVSTGPTAGPAAHGLAQLTEALVAKGVTVTSARTADEAKAPHVIVTGLASDRSVADLVADCGLALPTQPESLTVGRFQKSGRVYVVLCGGDAIGLMYAALDTAERIGWSTENEDPFTHIHNTVESPCLTDRSVSTYTMQRRLFEQHLYDEMYWKRYFDLLAKSRINSYVIIFGYENGGFMAPIYPYFFNVDGFPDVELYGMTERQQAKNTAALQRVIQLAHERGIRFTIGIWDHIYRGGVQGGGIAGASDLAGKKAPHLVYGVTTQNLASYTKAALKKLLTVFPDIDGIQFRMHWESGLTRKETPGFWHDVLSMLRQLQPKIQLDLRAKGLPDEVIDDAVAQGLPFRIGTKYWMEQLGMPFHPTHVNPRNQKDRRHGYADLLKYPKRYAMHWRIWSGGTARFLLWGDPEFVRRFVQSARVYDGRSFEVNEMLATKMLGEPHDAEPFDLLTPAYRYYDYEFERYWHYYQVWGRVTYHPDTPAELWEREFVRRFGSEAGPRIMKALHTASNILPRIVAASYNYRYFPTTRGWAEVMRLGDLPDYAAGTGTDVEQFQSYADAARQLLTTECTAKRTPFQTSQWFTRIANQILADADAAANAANRPEDEIGERELQATVTDLRILAHLARYHATRMKAAVWYNVYLQTKDRLMLSHCLQRESDAIEQWKAIIEAAGDVYPETLKFGVHRVGFSYHWKEELTKLKDGLKQLQQLSGTDTLDSATRKRLLQVETKTPDVESLAIHVDHAKLAHPGRDLIVTATARSEAGLQSVRLRYRHLTQFEDYETAEMSFDPATGKYHATIPGAFIVPEWDMMYFVEAIDRNGVGRCMPDLEKEMPYVIVPVAR